MAQKLYLSLTLFLLSADLLFVGVGGIKVKFGYFLVAGMWLLAPGAMRAQAAATLRSVPRYAFLLVIPALIAIATSVNPWKSAGWGLWLAFDAFTIVTILAYLRTRAFSEADVQAAAVGALALIALFGLLQFAAIQLFDEPIFSPQWHLGVYRLNGLSGWPHFLNIDAFLLLPLVLTGRRITVATGIVLALLLFVLVQSTAKTGWVLFGALAALLFAFNRAALLKRIVLFAVPVLAIALLVPLPAGEEHAPPITGAEKVARFGRDLGTTSSVLDRRLINEMGVNVWRAHPWFGVGPRAYDQYVFTRFSEELPGVNNLDYTDNVNAKNEHIWIEFLAEAGLPFTLGFLLLVVRALWVPRFAFANPLHLGAWIALVLYFAISGQVSQSGLLTLVYAVFGIYFHARALEAAPAAARRDPDPQRMPRRASGPAATAGAFEPTTGMRWPSARRMHDDPGT